MKNGAFFLLTLLFSQFAYSAIRPGNYSSVSPECQGLYLPDESPVSRFKMSTFDANQNLSIDVEGDSLVLDYHVTYPEHNGTGRLERSLMGNKYVKTKKNGGGLNSTYYNWKLSENGEGKIKIQYKSVVVFLGLPTITNSTCELELVE